ncbi:MAG TPA: helix-turn-helix transcriptional regulator [Verrucomicrobiae bacterium]|nr:helix-turn-helix transcriptional regulator [Verrucomicrobiae bacterium]
MLRGARLGAGKSQRDIARSLGVEFQQVSAWERGMEPIPEKHLTKLAKLLKLEIQALRIAVASDVQPLALDDRIANQRFQNLVGDRQGEVVVFSGKPASFSNPELSAAAVRFLRNEQNQLTFILPPLSDTAVELARDENSVAPEQARAVLAFARHTSLQEIVKLQEELSGGDRGARRRISFLALPPAWGEYPLSVRVLLQELSRLLHPLAVTILFEPKENTGPRAGFVFFSFGSTAVSKGEYAWLQLAPDFLTDLAGLLRVTLWGADKNTLFRDAGALLFRM